MIAQQVLHLVLKLYAREIVGAAYAGILKRDPDAEGLNAYAREIEKNGDLAPVLGDIAASLEAWEKHLCEHPDDIVRVIYQGVFGREPDPAIRSVYAGRLTATSDLQTLVSDMAHSREFWDETLARRSEELVRIVIQALLDRDPALNGTAASPVKLTNAQDLSSFLAEIGNSPEHWDHLFSQRSEELVQAVFRGLLEREPDPEALDFYAAMLAESKDLSEILSQISQSREHWDKLLAQRSAELVKAIFRGLLEQEPDPTALQSHCTALAQGRDLSAVLADIVRSPEFREQRYVEIIPDLVRAAYRGLLGREADVDGLNAYTEALAKGNELETVLRSIVTSAEFSRSRLDPNKWPHPLESYDVQTLVFLHIQKTAGTSIQNMLQDSFGKEKNYFEHSDSLHLHCPAELSQFTLFAGHFNHDSLAYIPRRSLSCFTFVRDPKERLLSLYYFLRAHEAGHPSYHEGMALANRLTIAEFFQTDVVLANEGFWNNITWAIMGHRQWARWRTLLASGDQGKKAEVLTDPIRPAIRRRLREFVFVGMQEDFERSIGILFKVLQRPQPAICADHSLEQLMKNDMHFKKSIQKQPYTAAVDSALDDLVQLDNIVYEEAKALYAERLVRESAEGSSASSTDAVVI